MSGYMKGNVLFPHNPQRCTEHMFALWRSRLTQSGISDHEAVDRLIFALKSTPQLAHLADRCMDMLGKITPAIPCILVGLCWFLTTTVSDISRQTLEF